MKIPPRPPLVKGGWGGFESYFLTKPESRVPGENRDPMSKMAPGFRRDDVWPPVSTGVTTFYENINVSSKIQAPWPRADRKLETHEQEPF